MSTLKIQSHTHNLFTITKNNKQKLYRGFKLSELPKWFGQKYVIGWIDGGDEDDYLGLKDSPMPAYYKFKSLILMPYEKKRTTMVTSNYKGMTVY